MTVQPQPPIMESPAWTERTKRTVALICLALLLLALWRLNEIFPILIIAALLSYLLNPLTTFLDRQVLSIGPWKGRSQRSLAIVLTFLLMIAFLVLVVTVVFPVLFDQLELFFARIPELYTTVESSLEDLLSQPIVINNQEFIPIESLREVLGTRDSDELIPLQNLDITGTLGTFLRSITGPAFSFVGSAFGIIINLIFLLTMMFYLLKDGNLFIDRMVALTPATYKSDMRRMFHELAKVWDAYLRGQLILCLAMGLLVFITATLLGVPNAPILGLLSGLLEFVPTLGPALALLPAALLALSSQSSTLPFLEGVTFMLVVVVVWTALQNVEAVLIVPRVMGDSLDLHPFVIIIGVIAGAALAGAFGVILAAPTIATLRLLARYIYGKLTDQDPFPEPKPGEWRRTHRGSPGHWLTAISRLMRQNRRQPVKNPKTHPKE